MRTLESISRLRVHVVSVSLLQSFRQSFRIDALTVAGPPLIRKSGHVSYIVARLFRLTLKLPGPIAAAQLLLRSDLCECKTSTN